MINAGASLQTSHTRRSDMPEYDTIEDLDYAPTIADDEHIRFHIRHVSGVRRLRRLGKMLEIAKHPVMLVVITWMLMAILLAMEISR